VPLLRLLAAGRPVRRPEFDPGSVQVGFMVDKVALGQVFPEYFGPALSISFHRCSITRKKTIMMMMMMMMINFIMRLHKKP
jgi:hypothetical protein